jgi:hypothetical protein
MGLASALVPKPWFYEVCFNEATVDAWRGKGQRVSDDWLRRMAWRIRSTRIQGASSRCST